jgi:hypothetical protein
MIKPAKGQKNRSSRCPKRKAKTAILFSGNGAFQLIFGEISSNERLVYRSNATCNAEQVSSMVFNKIGIFY